MSGNSTEPLNLFDYETLAQTRLSRRAWNYISDGAADEITLRANRQAFDALRLRPHMLRDVSVIDTTTSFLGASLAQPVMVAPMAYQRLACEEGEVAVAVAAAATQTALCLSTLSTREIGEVAAPHGSLPRFFQLYMLKDRGITRELVSRACASGFGAIVLTVDAPYPGRRERGSADRMVLPSGLHLANLDGLGGRESWSIANFASELDASLSWRDLDWLSSLSPLPVIVKGILRADDASMAIDHGAGAICVSNHGGRQLDTAIASITALPEIVQAVHSRCDVILDGGIRRGTDVLKALALGARAVLVGRPVIWGLAHSGAAGAQRVLELLRDEFRLAMALAGCARISDIDQSLVV